MGIVRMHLRKMPLLYGHGSISKWAVVAYRAADTMIWTGTCKTVGTKFYLGIRYNLHRNARGGSTYQFISIMF